MTTVFYSSDPLAKTSGRQKAIAREIASLVRRKVFQIVKLKDRPPNANIRGSKIVLSLNDIDTPNE